MPVSGPCKDSAGKRLKKALWGGRGETRRERAKPHAPKTHGQKQTKRDGNQPKNTEQQQQKKGAPQHHEKKTTREAQRQQTNRNRDDKRRREQMHDREPRTQTHNTKQCTIELESQAYLPSLRTDTPTLISSNFNLMRCKVQAKIRCTCLACGHASNHTCKCTADQILSVAKVETNLGGGEQEGVHLSSLRTDTPRKSKMQRSEAKTDETSVKLSALRD